MPKRPRLARTDSAPHVPRTYAPPLIPRISDYDSFDRGAHAVFATAQYDDAEIIHFQLVSLASDTVHPLLTASHDERAADLNAHPSNWTPIPTGVFGLFDHG
jgi:hypothetical protein